MKLYILTQGDNNNYDTYDSIIVCAENEMDAKTITPYEGYEFGKPYASWANSIDSVKCEEIGTANDQQKRGVILASFNAG